MTTTAAITAAVAAVAAIIAVTLVGAVGAGTVIDQPVPVGGCRLEPGRQPALSPTLDADQLAAARLVVDVGKTLGVPERGVAIALLVTMADSALNPAAVHGRAIGPFQQSGEATAGIDPTDPAAATRAFYARLAARVPDFDTVAGPLSVAAATVQAGGRDQAEYEPWEPTAVALADQLYDAAAQPNPTGSGMMCRPPAGPGPNPVHADGLTVHLPLEDGRTALLPFPNHTALMAAVSALSYLGTPYAWGGGGPNGPSLGIRDGGVADRAGDYRRIGFDCSGLMLYAYAQAGVDLPRQSRLQHQAGTLLDWASAQPGDLLFWGSPVHHVALYLGVVDGQHLMVEAPQSGAVVTISTVRTSGDFLRHVTRPY